MAKGVYNGVIYPEVKDFAGIAEHALVCGFCLVCHGNPFLSPW